MFRNVADCSKCAGRFVTSLFGPLLLGATLVLVGCTWLEAARPGPVHVDPVVKIGLVAPFEGRHRDVGYDVIYSARLAIREANEMRGTGDVRLALVAVDDSGDPEVAREVAAAMTTDPAIVAVVGHWLPETTNAVKPIYEKAGLPFLPTGIGILGAVDVLTLDNDFLEAYADVTPFGEVAGPYAGTAYDSVQFIIAALASTEQLGQEIDRAALGDTLHSMSHDGLTGTISMP